MHDRIKQRLDLIKKEAASSQFSPAFQDKLKSFEVALAKVPAPDAVSDVRKIWKVLTIELSDEDVSSKYFPKAISKPSTLFKTN